MFYHPTALLAVLAATATTVATHGLVTQVRGANGVNLPGLSVIDGTRRDCSSLACGAQDDASIIRNGELGTAKASALGRTQKGPVDAEAMIKIFLDSSGAAARRDESPVQPRQLRQVLGGGLLGGGGQRSNGQAESSVAASRGVAAAQGFPTTADDGTIELVYYQINQDGAGPLQAMIDPTSGGTDPAAFMPAEMVQDVPGLAAGLSLTTKTSFPVTVKMPDGMTCSGTIAGAQNLCIVRVRNNTPAGPFGGSAAFTQSAAARKRSIEVKLKRRYARDPIVKAEN